MLLAEATYLAQRIEGYKTGDGWMDRWRLIAITRKSDDRQRMEFVILAVDPMGREHTVNNRGEWDAMKRGV